MIQSGFGDDLRQSRLVVSALATFDTLWRDCTTDEFAQSFFYSGTVYRWHIACIINDCPVDWLCDLESSRH